MATPAADLSTLDRSETLVWRAWSRGLRSYADIARETRQAASIVRRALSHLRACGLIREPAHHEIEEPDPTPEQADEWRMRTMRVYWAKRFLRLGSRQELPADVLEELLPEGGSNHRQREYYARQTAREGRHA